MSRRGETVLSGPRASQTGWRTGPGPRSSAGWGRSWRGPWITPTDTVCCTATSSRPTCSSRPRVTQARRFQHRFQFQSGGGDSRGVFRGDRGLHVPRTTRSLQSVPRSPARKPRRPQRPLRVGGDVVGTPDRRAAVCRRTALRRAGRQARRNDSPSPKRRRSRSGQCESRGIGFPGSQDVLLQCLDPDLEKRPANGAALARQLELCLQPKAHTLLSPPVRNWRRLARRIPVTCVMFAAVLPNAVAAVFNYFYNRGKSSSTCRIRRKPLSRSRRRSMRLHFRWELSW